MKYGIGVVEGFFGPDWSWEKRQQFCGSLKSYGGEFYIYAPKRDAFLRKRWTEAHPPAMWNELTNLSRICKQSGVAFGVGLSPFEVHAHWNEETKKQLAAKIERLHELDMKYLGLFFDDMKGSPDLADRQIEIVDFVSGVTDLTLWFCPTYYSPDPILDKVFGQRPPDYLEKIGTLPLDVEILWTGSKVIPKTITRAELDDVAKILRRKPFLWENYFANDGPRQCKFLKLKPLEGRDQNIIESANGWAFNLMNQASLSEIVFATSVDVLKNSTEPNLSLRNSMQKLAGAELTGLLEANAKLLLEQGLDQIDEAVKKSLSRKLDDSRFSQEIRDWLDGKYNVGPECLTD